MENEGSTSTLDNDVECPLPEPNKSGDMGPPLRFEQRKPKSQDQIFGGPLNQTFDGDRIPDSQPLLGIPNSASPQAGNEGSPDAKFDIEDMDWKGLSDRYIAAMKEAKAKEDEIHREFVGLVNVSCAPTLLCSGLKAEKTFRTWISASAQQERHRSAKRLKTQSDYVKGAEKSLRERRQHYNKVVEAFEKALALLRES
ncbi:MAG: hypothetical protein M1829_005201 [Trizodia sp. TS-e1964]|nr:MAG: hypothetical protein M1829_005201 [Trizodia sp. TS-e1964]